ncbi:hypothetical protein Y032_0059g3038 [Ancylostoma ceylanicum]|uniref:Uncharacterized protein n=1 Tax=Ancylostoma ceylanicum TaxID=53326 RepID=A0A016U4J5_9BILA|nr:hypothetical protein Y032_0059g3038 [Ancylostoma ceylanicum]
MSISRLRQFKMNQNEPEKPGDKDCGNDAYRSPRHIAMDRCQAELIASFVWSLLLHFIHVATTGGRGEVWGYSLYSVG